jgi:hypothetical protein
MLRYRNPITPNITMTRLITMARTGRLMLVEDKLIRKRFYYSILYKNAAANGPQASWSA